MSRVCESQFKLIFLVYSYPHTNFNILVLHISADFNYANIEKLYQWCNYNLSYSPSQKRENALKKKDFYMAVARLAEQRSKDPKTQVQNHNITCILSSFFLSHPCFSAHGFLSQPLSYHSYSSASLSFLCIILHFFTDVVISVSFFSPATNFIALAFASLPFLYPLWLATVEEHYFPTQFSNPVISFYRIQKVFTRS